MNSDQEKQTQEFHLRLKRMEHAKDVVVAWLMGNLAQKDVMPVQLAVKKAAAYLDLEFDLNDSFKKG